jgi:pyridoxamine 5'-phosphate oxidase
MTIHPSQIANLRVDYSLKSFSEQDLHQDPFMQFDSWMSEAIEARVNEPNAMTLATVKADGTPSARIVLLKGFDPRGFVFFTNYDSDKGIQLQQNPNAALVFCWLELQRQVRIEGRVSKVSAEESDAYFASRPLGSRIGAIASPQSRVIESRKMLEERYEALTQKATSEPVTRPENWGGFIVEPQLIEFWQGRTSRLHDRFRFEKINETWKTSRLAP